MSAASPQSLREIIDQLDAIEGASFFHGARFYASTADLELERYRTAKRLATAGDVARTEYLEKLRIFRESDCSMGCAWCMASFMDLSQATIVGTKLVHRETCAREFDEFVSHCDEVNYEVTDAGRNAIAGDENAEDGARRTA